MLIGYGLRVIGYGELRIPVIENGKDDAASKSPRITQGKEKNRAEMRLPKFGRCMAARRAVPESNSGAKNEAWTAEYRLKQDTAALTRSALNKVEEEGSPKLVDAWRVNYGCKGNKNK